MSTAANSSSAPIPGPYSSPPITIILAIVILVFFFVGFFSIYFCRCVMENIVSTWNIRRSPSGNLVSVACASTHQGLDPSQIQTFPTFKYSSVKDLRREKYGLECAICLSEFENESLLRLLTVCYHVFHQECIDLWLDSHKTCPVCRRILDPTDESFGKASPQVGNENANDNVDNSNVGQEANRASSRDDEVHIDIRDDHDENDHDRDGDRDRDQEEEGRRERGESSSSKKGGENASDEEEVEVEVADQGKLSRSHTTGHSIRKRKEEEDRYTLRLPDHVRSRILRGHNWTGSCTTFEDISKNMASETYGEAGFSGGDINKS